MKNRLRTLAAAALVILLAACGTNTATPASPADNGPTAVFIPPTIEPNSPCANAYYPVKAKAMYTYTSTGSPSGAYSFRNIVGNLRADGFTLTTKYRKLTLTQEWACKPEGLIASSLGFTDAASVLAFERFVNLTPSNVTGVTLPPNLAPGAEWSYSLDLQGTEKAKEGDPAGTMTGRISLTFKAGNMESVSVPAGVFDALAVEIHNVSEFNVVSASGETQKISIDNTYTVWYAAGIGWVKSNGFGTLNGQEYFETIVLESYRIR